MRAPKKTAMSTWLRLWPAAILLFLAPVGCAEAQTTPPIAGVQLATAPMVAPATAWSFYGSGTAHTVGAAAWAGTPPELTALARSLGAGRSGVTAAQYSQNVYDYIRNNIAIEFHFGLAKGARSALIDQSGTAFDQAQLMVELLRINGITANYQVGTITLNAQQFGAWTGFIASLDQPNQTFTVNAQAACKFMADGGIPISIGGVADCSQLSGNLSSITLGHIWVNANGILYDPAFKMHKFKASIDLAAAVGCGTASAPTCGSTLTAATLSGSTSGTFGPDNLPTLQNLNESATNVQMTTYALNLQNYLRLNLPSAKLDDVVGGAEIDTTFQPIVGANLGYTTNAVFTWTDDIPDQYRIKWSLLYNSMSQLFYADETSGRRVRLFLDNLYPANVNYSNTGIYVSTAKIMVDDTLIQSVLCQQCNSSTGHLPVGGNLTVSAIHPYAGGTYADQSLVTPYLEPATIVQTWGESTFSTQKYFTDLQVGDPSPFVGAASAPTASCENPGGLVQNGQTTRMYQLSCRNDEQPTLIALFEAQRTMADGVVGAINGAPIITHHTIGVLSAPLGSAGIASGYAISAEASVSIQSTSNQAASRSASFEVSNELYGGIEGLVNEQTADVPDQTTTGTATNGQMDSDLSGLISEIRSGLAFVEVPPSAMAATLPSLNVPNATYNGVNPYNNWLTAAADGMSFIFALQNVVIQQQSQVSPGAYSIGYSPSYLSYDIGFNRKGGGGAGSVDPAGDAIKAARVVRADRKKYFNVNLASGNVDLAPPPDIVAGSGEFPNSLPFQRFYDSGDGAKEFEGLGAGLVTAAKSGWSWLGTDQYDFSRIGGGWRHNFQISAHIASDGLRAMGSDDAVDASAFVASVFSLSDLLKSPTYNQRYSSFLVAYWSLERCVDNIVSINLPPDNVTFEKLADGSFNPPPGSGDQLVQSGARAGPSLFSIDGISQAPRFDYSPVTFSYTQKSGAVIAFDVSSTVKGAVSGSGGADPTWGEPIFKADSWSFPSGVSIIFSYGTFSTTRSPTHTPVYSYNYLTGVSNNFGRSLTFSTSQTGTYQGLYQYGVEVGQVITAVTDDSGRTVNFALTNCPGLDRNNGGGSSFESVALACDTVSATSPGLETQKYTYEPGSDSPDPAVLLRSNYRLRRVFAADNSITPYDTISYDELYRIRTNRDVLGRVTTYYPSAVTDFDGLKRTDVVGPLGESTTDWFDQWGSLVQAVDALGRATTYKYDGLRRVTLVADPSLGCTATMYDLRSNILSTVRYPAPTAASPSTGCNVVGQMVALNAGPGTPIVTSNSYQEGVSVYPCSNMAICDQPSAQTDGRGGVTNYMYNATTGQMTQVLKPTDATGNRPETDYRYTGYAGVGSVGGTVSLLSSKTDWITKSPSRNVVTSYAYNTANKLTLSTATVDSGTGGLALRTCFKFDAVGNLISTSDPRATICP